jgi:hypothetical protein
MPRVRNGGRKKHGDSKLNGSRFFPDKDLTCHVMTNDLPFKSMSNLAEIEAAIERLAEPQIEELSKWLDRRLAAKSDLSTLEAWLQQARGAAAPGVTTDALLEATRGNQ